MAQPTHGISEKQISQSLLDLIENQASSLQTGYELTPAIVTNPTNGAVEIKVGSGADSDKVLIIENTAGAEVASIDGQGNFVGGTFNGYIPENQANKQNSLSTDGTATKFPTVDAVNVFKTETENNLSTLSADLLTKLPKGTYTGTATDLANDIVAISTGVQPAGATTTNSPTGTGIASWIFAGGGTYTNYGGLVIPANHVGFITRSATNTYSFVSFELNLSLYAKRDYLDGLIKNDDSGKLNFIDENGNIGAQIDENGTFSIYNINLINQTTPIPFVNIEASGLINGNKIVKNDNYQIVTTDINGNIGYAVNLDGTVISFKGDEFKLATGILAEYNGIEVYGQSNSVGEMAQPPLTTTTESNIWTFKKGPIMNLYDNDVDRYDSLVLEKESTRETASGSLARMLKQEVLDSGIVIDNLSNPWNIIISNSGQGAMTIQNLSRGSVNYSRLINSISNAKRLANESGGSYNFNGMFWLQGEANESDTSKSKYIYLLKKFHRELNEDVKNITGQSNDLFIINYQFSAYGARNLDVYTALMDICIDSNVFFRGPTLYPYPFADQHHLSNFGQRHVGALAGYIFDQIQNKGVKWEGFIYDTHLVSGNFVELKFKVPVKPIVLDTVIVTDPGNYGFNLYNKFGIEKPITTITLVRDDKVKVVSNSNIEVGDYLTYASNGISTTSGPVTGARGCLRDSQGETVRYQPTGLNLKLHNWLPICKIILK